MKRNCREFESRLAALAEGGHDLEVEEHVSVCPNCNAKLSGLKTMLTAARRGHFNAPSEMVLRAQLIFVPSKRVVFGSLLNLGAAGARSTSTEIGQLRLQAEDVSVTMMVRPEGKSWQVMGVIEGPLPSTLSIADESFSCRSARFEFLTNSLEEEIWLEYEDRQIRFPLQLSE
ncbi:MAG: hypothetical protein ABL949_08665 [Fimbriimonadaceae bacterium]